MRDKRAIRFDRIAAFCLFERFGRLNWHEISVVDQGATNGPYCNPYLSYRLRRG
jgi:hypothetical protein